MCGRFPTTGETYCVPSSDKCCRPNVPSMGVDWSGSVTRRGYGLASAVVVLHGVDDLIVCVCDTSEG